MHESLALGPFKKQSLVLPYPQTWQGKLIYLTIRNNLLWRRRNWL